MDIVARFDEAAERFRTVSREVFTRNNMLRAAGIGIGVGILFTAALSRTYGTFAGLGAFAGIVVNDFVVRALAPRPKAATPSSQPSPSR